MNESGITWLASYPRSGNTWVRLLLAHALADAKEDVDLNRLPFGSIAFSRNLVDDILGLETAELPPHQVQELWPRACHGIAETLSPPAYIKSHARWPEHQPEHECLAKATAGVVLITRHPANVAVSLSRFLNVSLDEAIALMSDEQYWINQPDGGTLEFLPQWVGSWSSHLNSWLDSGMRLLVVRYEDMVTDPRRELARILSFSNLEKPSADIDRAVQATQIGHLQTLESNQGFREAPRTPAPFFGSGGGKSKTSVISKQQSKILTHDHGIAMARLHYE